MKYNAIMGKISSQKLGTKLNPKEEKAYLNYNGLHYNNIGFYYNSKEQYDSALYFFNKAVIQLEKSNNQNSLAQTLQNMGTIYDSKGEPTQVLKYYNQVLAIYKDTNDSIGLANIYADFGRIYIDNGSINKALEFYTKSMKISDLINDKASKFRTIRYLVVTLGNQGEFQKLLEYVQELINYYEEIGDYDSLGLIYNITASTHSNLKNYPQMFKYIDKAIVIAKKLKSPDRLAENYGLLAVYYKNHQQIDSAYKYANFEVEIRKNNVSEPKYTKSLIIYADILKLKKQFKEAEKIGIIAYQRSQKLANPDLIMQAARKMKEIYSNLNNISLAFKYAEIELQMKDTLNTVNTKNSAIKALFKYETEAKDNEIIKISQQNQITQLESKRKNTFIYSILCGILALIAIAYFSFSKFKTKKANELLSSQLEEAEKRIEIEQKATESELKALKSQMNPHFMFNALNSIQEQFMFGDKNVANEQMGNFTYLTRQILSVSGKKKIKLSTEIEILNKYLELEKMRFAEGFKYEINIGIINR
ncbi:MAG: tetratricopeptide repeat protein [Emticicia sp.]|nr:tetratricopeptide repeat protein [Emticicia sp.]